MYFSVIIPCYNAAQTIDRALSALLAQKDYLKQIILIDDGSQDNTSEKIKSNLDRYPEIIQYHSQSNQGPAVARNKGAALATGDYTMFIDADDAIRPHALSVFHEAFKQNPQIDLLIAGYCSIHGNKKDMHQIKASNSMLDILKAVWFGHFSPVMAVMPMRTHVLQCVQYPTSIRHGEDIVFFSHLVSAFQWQCVDAVTMDIYHHTGSLRHHLSSAMKDQDAVVNLLFNPAYLAPDAMTYRHAFHAKKLLSLARIAVKTDQKPEARSFLRKAFQLDPRILFKFKTWKTLFRSCL